MSLVEVIIRLSVVSLLLGYLYLKHRQRAPSHLIEKQWPGHGIVVNDILERVQEVRHDYVSGLHPRPNQLWQRMGLQASARRVVAHLGFFRNLESRRLNRAEQGPKTHFAG